MEVKQFLKAAQEICPDYQPLFLMAVRAGLRRGGLGQHRKKHAMVEVIRVENRPLRGSKNELAGDVVLAFQVSFQQALVSQFDENSR